MAIDSAEKRRSVSGIQSTLIAGVTPNSSKDQEWRQESGWGYSGILVSAVIEIIITGVRRIFTFNDKRHVFIFDDATRIFTFNNKRHIFRIN